MRPDAIHTDTIREQTGDVHKIISFPPEIYNFMNVPLRLGVPLRH